MLFARRTMVVRRMSMMKWLYKPALGPARPPPRRLCSSSSTKSELARRQAARPQAQVLDQRQSRPQIRERVIRFVLEGDWSLGMYAVALIVGGVGYIYGSYLSDKHRQEKREDTERRKEERKRVWADVKESVGGTIDGARGAAGNVWGKIGDFVGREKAENEVGIGDPSELSPPQQQLPQQEQAQAKAQDIGAQALQTAQDTKAAAKEKITRWMRRDK